MITVIDYGMGNSGSILNMLARIGAEAELTSDAARIAKADKLVLPGVGAFDKGMAQLRKLGLVDVLTEKVVAQGTPILGICLGMQLFTEGSEEGSAAGLGWIEGRCEGFRFDAERGLRVPHMGWNTVRVEKAHPALEVADDARFYFVHSYYVKCAREEDVVARTEYGSEFVSAVAKGAVLGVQFHPEKSLRWGMQLFRRWVSDVQRSAPAGDSVPAAAQHGAGQDD